jgi:hypothetical protein
MTQRELNEAVAQATGEDLQTIRQLGFSEVPPGTMLDEAALLNDLDPEPCL